MYLQLNCTSDVVKYTEAHLGHGILFFLVYIRYIPISIRYILISIRYIPLSIRYIPITIRYTK